MRSRAALAAALAAAALVLVLLLAPRALGNAWGLLTGRGYMVPAESSVFTFDATVMNPGSGEWWLYGEDGRYFYHFTGEGKVPYLKVERSAAARCPGFAPHDAATWAACTAR